MCTPNRCYCPKGVDCPEAVSVNNSKATSNMQAASPYLAELTILLKEYVYMVKNGDLFTIKINDRTISSFTLKQMPGCCGICISTGAAVDKKYQGRGVGTILNRMRFALARYQNYSAIICTDVMTNIPQRKILAKNGWKDAFVFKNSKTKNQVALSYYVLEEPKPEIKKADKKVIPRSVGLSKTKGKFFNYDTSAKVIKPSSPTPYDMVFSTFKKKEVIQ